MPTKTQNNQLIVGGFHRSGTSMTMQAFVNAGLFAGDELLPAHPSNPDGHFEDRAIVALHDEILASQGRQWLTAGGPITAIEKQYEARARDIINRYELKSIPWGFKDPRACLFLDFWHTLLPNPAAVIVYRSYLSSFRSLRYRQAQMLAYNPERNKHNLQFWLDPLLSLRIWLDHNKALLKYAKEHQETVIVASCEAMLSGYDLIQAAELKFNLNLKLDSDRGIKKSNRQETQNQTFHTEVPEDFKIELDDTLQALNDLSECSGAPKSDMPPVGPALDYGHESSQSKDFLKRLGVTTNPVSLTSVQNPGSKLSEATIKSPSASCASIIKVLSHLVTVHNFTDANRIVDQWMSKFSTNAHFQLEVGKLHLKQLDLKRAELHLMHSHHLNDQLPWPLFHLGFLEQHRKHFLKAALYFELAIIRAPEHSGLYLYLCQALVAADRFVSALTVSTRGLEVNPEDIELQALRIRLLIDSGLAQEAREQCQQMMSRYPNEAVFSDHYSELQRSLGDKEDALHHMYQGICKKMRTLPDYYHHLNTALVTVSSDVERSALAHQVNRELQTIANHVLPAEHKVASQEH